ncbi:uncharacterized protein [Musca autumnalis]|uniref:uncharacterized protein n=1 Tax=Musca autumnalis TaxID=221902 RepID=UPI003CECCD06
MFLLHYMGAGTYDMLCDKLSPSNPEDNTYEEIVKLLSEHFNPKPNVILENYRFNLCRQNEDETCAEYLVTLRRLATNCGSYLNTALRNQFVFGLRNSTIQSRLLEKADLTIDSAINMANTCEAAAKGGMELHQGTNNMVVDLIGDRKKVKKLQQPKENKKCFRCGSGKHLANQCVHRDTICHFCKLKGHIRRVCLKASRHLNQISEDISEDEQNLVEEINQIYEGDVKNIQNEKWPRIVLKSRIDSKLTVPQYVLKSILVHLYQ